MKFLLKVLMVLTVVMGFLTCTSCGSVQTTGRYVNSQRNTNHMMNSVVALVITSPLGEKMIGCSAFFVSPTQIVTAEHCVERRQIGVVLLPNGQPGLTIDSFPPTENMEVEYVTYTDWSRWKSTESLPHNVTRPELPTHVARVTRWNADTDVAVLTVAAAVDQSKDWLNMRTGLPLVGERIYTVSQPGEFRWMFSEGIVAQVESLDGRTYIMATAPIFFGSSGCPLIDNNGEVIGIASAIAYRQSTFGIFVPIRNARSLMPSAPRR